MTMWSPWGREEMLPEVELSWLIVGLRVIGYEI